MNKVRIQRDVYFSFRRFNFLPLLLAGAITVVSSYPKLLLEVWLRNRMGKRYFNFISALTVAFLLVWWPYIFQGGFYGKSMYYDWHEGGGTKFARTFFPLNGSKVDITHAPFSFELVLQADPVWSMMLCSFLLMAFIKQIQTWIVSRYVDIEKGTSYEGDSLGFLARPWLPRFSLRYGRWKLFNLPGSSKSVFFSLERYSFSRRTVSILVEPAFCFFIGGALGKWVHPGWGLLVQLCSLIYSISYWFDYFQGDESVSETLDTVSANHYNAQVIEQAAQTLENNRASGVGREPANVAQQQVNNRRVNPIDPLEP